MMNSSAVLTFVKSAPSEVSARAGMVSPSRNSAASKCSVPM